MSLFEDRKYIRLLGSQLNRFRETKNGVFLCRCPKCNDSKKNKLKSRFYFIPDTDKYNVFCHNCSYSKPFWYLLKEINPNLYNEYLVETFHKKAEDTPEIEKYTIPKKDHTTDGLVKISTLRLDHPARKYVDSRKIPTNVHYKLYYTQNFSKWLNEKFPELEVTVFQKVEPRLVLPLVDREGKIFGVCARDLTGRHQLRYITRKFEDKPKVYGLDTVDPNCDILVVEGAIDSLFLENAIAEVGADIPLAEIRDAINPGMSFDRFVIVHDNERRNLEIVERISRKIKQGLRVVIWPMSFQFKDINEAIQGGWTSKELMKLIQNNTYSGLSAQLKLSQWRLV